MGGNKVKVVILAGGYGTRLAENSNSIPKPMVAIGGKPILWHIMNYYSSWGFTEFILALGYKAEVIKSYFKEQNLTKLNFDIYSEVSEIIYRQDSLQDWNIKFVDTGLDTMTGGRILKLKEVLKDQAFMLTYGDGLGNVNIKELLQFHTSHNKSVSVTAVHPPARFGELSLDGNTVVGFQEKPQLQDSWINGGFFVMEPDFLNFIPNLETMLEGEPLQAAVKSGQLMAFPHEGFWLGMDTKRDHERLEKLYKEGAPWLHH